MFSSNKSERLPGPREIPGPAKAHLINTMKVDPDVTEFLKSVIRHRENDGKKVFDIRIFDDADAIANKVEIKNYTTFDEHPELIIYDGWYDESSKRAELTEKKKLSQEVTILSENEILQKIEALTEPGSTVFFYMARGPGNGGPLGRGAAVVELAPQIPGKKHRKYNIYGADVIEMRPLGKGSKIYDSDKANEIAKWIKEAHHKRLY